MSISSACECCPIQQDPCNGLVLGVFQPIILIVLIGILSQVLLQYLPAKNTLPSWSNLLVVILIELIFGFFIQHFGCVRNMWQKPSCKTLMTAFLFIIFFPLFLPIVLEVL